MKIVARLASLEANLKRVQHIEMRDPQGPACHPRKTNSRKTHCHAGGTTECAPLDDLC